jgi:hypothetical protein
VARRRGGGGAAWRRCGSPVKYIYKHKIKIDIMEKPAAKSAAPNKIPSPPENFKQTIQDLICDLNTVYPEYSQSWKQWTKENLTEDELNKLYQYCFVFYPERFFDILYKNEDIFQNENTTNTFFLPNVEFKALYNCEGVSEKTQTTIWKYLQLIMFSIVQTMSDSSLFGGDCIDMFKNIDTEDLRQKLDDTLQNLTELFDAPAPAPAAAAADEAKKPAAEESDDEEAPPSPFSKFDAEKIHDHINSLLSGKIGNLAKELAEDVSKELNDDILNMSSDGFTGDTAFDTKTLIGNMMKNPAKMMDLVKKIGGKLDDKMKSGDLSQEELMREASDIMEKMKDIPGMKDIKSILKQFGRGFGAGGAEGMAEAMAGLGKDSRIDTNALNRASKNQQMKDKLRARLDAKKRAQVEAAVAAARAAVPAPAAAAVEIDPSLFEPDTKAAPTPAHKKKAGKSGKKGKK